MLEQRGHITAESVARYIFEQNKRLKDKWDMFDLEPFEYDVLDGKERLPKNQMKLDVFV